MADVSSLDSVIGSELTDAQIQGILNRLHLNLYNMMAGKWDAVDYAEFGPAGHKTEPSKLIAECRKLIELYTTMLHTIPAMAFSQWDDPSL